MKIEVKCSCGKLTALALECMFFTCSNCSSEYTRSGPPPGNWKRKKAAKYKNKKAVLAADGTLFEQDEIKRHGLDVQGKKFDSKMEANYYLYLMNLMHAGVVKTVQLQPVFKLPADIKYIADYDVVFMDGSRVVVDVKGAVTKEFKLKYKLFRFTFPELPLQVLKYENGEWTEIMNRKGAKRNDRVRKSGRSANH